MRPRMLSILLGAALALPQTALACHQLTQSIWMCAGDTAWSEAKWDPYGDGTTLLLDRFVLNFTDKWPGAEIRDDKTTLQEQYVTYAALAEADGAAPLEVHRQELIEFDTGSAWRSLQRDRYDEIETVSAVMLADVQTERVMLYLDGPATLDWEEIDESSRAVLALLRDSCADEATCASPDQTLIGSD